MNITIKKIRLLDKLQENRKEHLEEFEEAEKSFQNKLIKLLTTMLEDSKASKNVDLQINLTKPINYLREYDRAISMLENCIEDSILLDQSNYTQLFMNNWTWSRTYLLNNAAYSTRVSAKLSD